MNYIQKKVFLVNRSKEIFLRLLSSRHESFLRFCAHTWSTLMLAHDWDMKTCLFTSRLHLLRFKTDTKKKLSNAEKEKRAKSREKKNAEFRSRWKTTLQRPPSEFTGFFGWIRFEKCGTVKEFLLSCQAVMRGLTFAVKYSAWNWNQMQISIVLQADQSLFTHNIFERRLRRNRLTFWGCTDLFR